MSHFTPIHTHFSNLICRESAEPDDVVEDSVDRIVGGCSSVADVRDGVGRRAEVVGLPYMGDGQNEGQGCARHVMFYWSPAEAQGIWCRTQSGPKPMCGHFPLERGKKG